MCTVKIKSVSNTDLWVVELKLLFSVFPNLSVKEMCVFSDYGEKNPTVYIRERRDYLFLDLYLAGSSPYLA